MFKKLQEKFKTEGAEKMRYNKLHVICAWCGKILQYGNTQKNISHGICRACADAQAKVRRETDE